MLSLAAVLATLVVTGCDDSSEGPLTLNGDGMIVDPVAQPVWFRVHGCVRESEDPADIILTKITTSPNGDNSHVATRVAWGDDSPDVLAEPGQPPATYRPVSATAHAGGTVDGCSLSIAVVLSPGATDPIIVRSVNVAYEVDGKAYLARTELGAVLCPEGTHASSHTDGCSSRATSTTHS
jgi:hypothetical protein